MVAAPSEQPPARLRVVELSGGWGLGGTDQAIEVRAGLLSRRWFDVSAVGLWGGPRYERLLARGVNGMNLEGKLADLPALLERLKPHLVHYTRADRACGYSEAVQRFTASARVPVLIETNVFGRPPGFDEPRRPDRTCHMSLASMLRCANQARTTMRSLFERGHRAVYLPVVTDAGYAPHGAPSRDDARRSLGIEPGELLACRVARPDVRKWSVRLELALPALFDAVPELRFAFMAAPEKKVQALTKRFGRRVMPLHAASDLTSVARLYAASDLMIHSSGIGESFGLSLAEGMHHGLPVIVDSTPDMDNAQIEVVDHERTGLVVASSAGFVEALVRVARDAELRKRLGAAAADSARSRFADTVVTRTWEALYAEAAALAGVPLPAGLSQHVAAGPKPPGGDQYVAFEKEYERRLTQRIGPPEEFSDVARGAWVRAGDMLGWTREIGARTVWRVVRSRLRSTGTLKRN